MAAYKKAVPLADMLRTEIARRRMTQEEVALEMQVKQPTINRWLSGTVIPRPHYYLRLQAFLDVDDATLGQAIHLQQTRRETLMTGFGDLGQRISEIEAELSRVDEQRRQGKRLDVTALRARAHEARETLERMAALQGLQLEPIQNEAVRIATGETDEEPSAP